MIDVCGIYKITSPSGKIYIGQSENIYKRWKGYYKLRCKDQIKLHNSLKKCGFENHIFEIIEKCLQEMLDEREVYWVKFFDTFQTSHGMNLKEPGAGGRISDESKKKMSQTRKEKISNGEITIWNKGKKCPPREDEIKNKISLKLMGTKRNPFTEEHLLKLSLAKKGKKASIETREKLSKAKAGTKPSEETILKATLIKQKRVNQINPDTKEVIKIWSSVKEILEYYNIVGGRCFRKNSRSNKVWKNYLWKYE